MKPALVPNGAWAKFTAFADALHSSASSGGRTGSELWKVTAKGSVVQVADIEPQTGDSFPSAFAEFSGNLYFSAYKGRHGFELWKVEADGSVVQAADIAQGIDEFYPEGFTIFDPSGVLLF